MTRSPAQVRRPGCLVSWRADALEDHGIVLAHGAVFLMAEDMREIGPAERDKGAGRVGRGAVELLVVGGGETSPEIGIGRLAHRDAREAEFVDQAILQGPVEALAAAPRLGGVREDVLNAQAGQRPADLRELGPIHAAAGLRGVEGPAGPVGVEGHGDPVGSRGPRAGRS